MKQAPEPLHKSIERGPNIIRVHLSDWLFNAGVLGFIRILSNNQTEISESIRIVDDETCIEFDRDILNGFTDRFFETAFQFHGKFDSIRLWLQELAQDLRTYTQTSGIELLVKKYRIDTQREEKLVKGIIDEIGKRWKGVAYEAFKKIKKSDANNLRELVDLITDLLNILQDKREFFVEKEVQTFLRGIIGGGSFLNITVNKNQKQLFKKDFETPIATATNPFDNKFICIHCNDRTAKKNTIFNTGLVFYQGLNKDSVNFVWGFDPNLPLCEICELIYFCHWAGFTKGFKDKTYLFINDDSSVRALWEKNQLLRQELVKDRKENILINYFHELLVREESIKSIFALQNISVIQVDLEKKIMPKVLSLYVSRRQAQYIKDNHEMLKWQATRYYKIKDDYNNLLKEYIDLLLSEKLNYDYATRLLKYYIQSLDESKSSVAVNYSPVNLLSILVLINEYHVIVKQKPRNMESKFIWHIYHLGNDMRDLLIKLKAKNKINSIAYRLLNAVRSDDKSTFLNLLLRIYVSTDAPVPKSLVGTLENEEKFQIIGLSYINGLLGEPLSQTKTES